MIHPFRPLFVTVDVDGIKRREWASRNVGRIPGRIPTVASLAYMYKRMYFVDRYLDRAGPPTRYV